MNLEPAPRLPKLPFFVADAVLLIAAAALAKFSAHPLDTTIVVLIAVLVMIGAGLIIAPFIIAYVADHAESLQRERERVNDQVARLHAATESLARAAAQIKAVEDAVHKVARDAETLPYRMQEKLAEFNETLAAKEDSDREALETELEELRAANSDQLKHTAEKISKAAADWAALETATRKQLTAAEAALAKLQDGSTDAATQFQTKVSTALKELEAKIVDLKQAAASVPTTITVATASAPTLASPVETAAPAAPPAAAASHSSEANSSSDSGHKAPPQEQFHAATPAPAPTAPLASGPVSVAEIPAAVSESDAPAAEPPHTAAVTEPPKPKKPRAPRKPKPEETLLDISSDAPAAPAEKSIDHAPASLVAAAASAPEPIVAPAPAESPAPSASDEPASESASSAEVESSTSSDGATRLLATAYIGIGNKLFIRGDGPGLSWDRGVPMQFVSIGKWGWFTHDASGPVRCKLYKNDDLASLTGEITLEAGRHTEVTALF
jgi:hypothetical protein